MRRRRVTFRSLAAAGLVLAGLAAAPPGSEEPAGIPGCADPVHEGGDWRNYGSGLDNSRSQPLETTITPENAGDLEVAWTYSPLTDGLGDFQSTPVVFAGCVFLSGGGGHVIIRNADTGDLAWRTSQALPGNAASLVGRRITGSPAVSDDFWIYVGVLRNDSPYVAAFEPVAAGTWALAWTSVVDTTDAAQLVTGPLLYDVPAPAAEDGGGGKGGGKGGGGGGKGGPKQSQAPSQLLFQGFMGNESSATARGGYAILDPATGEILAKDYAIDDEAYAQGYRGASIWGTATVDTATGYIYAPTGNPASNTLEHPNSNAIVKIDGNPARATFGQIVDTYKGNPDNYLDQVDLYENPLCQALGDDIGVVWGQLCGQLDLDFGAAPNLMVDADGQTTVGALQKSGVYHWIDADTMDGTGQSVVGAPGIPVNAAASAFNDDRVFVNAQPPGQLWGLDRGSRSADWVHPMADGVSYLAVSTANGVVYAMDAWGNLRIIDADTGVPIAVKSLTTEFGTLTTASGENSPGIAIARNTLYVTIPERVIAFRLPASEPDPDPSDPPSDPPVDPPSDVPTGSTVVAHPTSSTTGYTTRVATTSVGGDLTFANLDTALHNVVAYSAKGPDDEPWCSGYQAGQCPLFWSPLVGLSGTTQVQGLDNIVAGETYEYYCTIHTGMRGQLVVQP